VKLTETLFPPGVWPGRDRGFPQPDDDIAVDVAVVLVVIFVKLAIEVVVLVVKVVKLLDVVEDAEPELSNLAPQTPLFACAACTVLFM